MSAAACCERKPRDDARRLAELSQTRPEFEASAHSHRVPDDNKPLPDEVRRDTTRRAQTEASVRRNSVATESALYTRLFQFRLASDRRRPRKDSRLSKMQIRRYGVSAWIGEA